MYLEHKLPFFIAFAAFLIFISCEASTNYKSDKVIYNKPLNSDSKNKIKSKTSLETPEKNIVSKNEKTLNVGLMLPLSGKHYHIGQSLLNSAQLAIEKTNNKNLIFKIVDTGNDEELLTQLYNLLEQDVDIFIGPVFSDKVVQVKEIFRNKKIPIISLSNNSQLEDEGLYVFGLTLEDEINEIINFSYKNNIKKYSVIIPMNEFGKRIKKEFDEHNYKNKLLSFKFIFYDTISPDFYEVSKRVSNYEERKLNLENKIQSLEIENSEAAKKELKKLKKMDTYGDLDFEALIIFAQNFREVSSFSSILPYYDVDPKEIQYIGNSMWSKNQALKEPGLTNGYFTSLNMDNNKNFDTDYINIFNSKPHALATLTYDIVGLISRLHTVESKFTLNKLHNSHGFIGIDGWFKILPEGKVLRQPSIYKIKNQKFILLN